MRRRRRASRMAATSEPTGPGMRRTRGSNRLRQAIIQSGARPTKGRPPSPSDADTRRPPDVEARSSRSCPVLHSRRSVRALASAAAPPSRRAAMTIRKLARNWLARARLSRLRAVIAHSPRAGAPTIDLNTRGGEGRLPDCRLLHRQAKQQRRPRRPRRPSAFSDSHPWPSANRRQRMTPRPLTEPTVRTRRRAAAPAQTQQRRTT